MPFVSITRLRVRRWRYLPRFLYQSIRAAREAERAAGNLAVSVLRDADRAFWTRTVWRDEQAMRSFMQSGVHRRIMARLPEWCDEAAVVHWVQDAEEPPSWTVIISRPVLVPVSAHGSASVECDLIRTPTAEGRSRAQKRGGARRNSHHRRRPRRSDDVNRAPRLPNSHAATA